MVTVLLVLPLQKFALNVVPGASLTNSSGMIIFIWATIEELMKLVVAWVVILRHRKVDEPIDIPIYLITLALGFAALENTLFLLTPLGNGELLGSFLTGNLRFLGATLIHVLSSAVIGGALAFAFFEGHLKKLYLGAAGVILAVLLHTLFNFTIINTRADNLLTIFAGVWVGIVFLLLLLERVKLLQRPAWWEKMFTPK
jgi:RsiW-degrading membrane proteinase PrsW (M82 family)